MPLFEPSPNIRDLLTTLSSRAATLPVSAIRPTCEGASRPLSIPLQPHCRPSFQPPSVDGCDEDHGVDAWLEGECAGSAG
jgi:hypothetical protein